MTTTTPARPCSCPTGWPTISVTTGQPQHHPHCLATAPAHVVAPRDLHPEDEEWPHSRNDSEWEPGDVIVNGRRVSTTPMPESPTPLDVGERGKSFQPQQLQGSTMNDQTQEPEPTRDATVCARTVSGRVEPVSGYLRHLAAELECVDWPPGTGGVQAILDAADALDDLRKDSERMEWCERHMQEANVFDPPSGDAWVWALGYVLPGDADDGTTRSTEGHTWFRDAIDAAMSATDSDQGAATDA